METIKINENQSKFKRSKPTSRMEGKVNPVVAAFLDVFR